MSALIIIYGTRGIKSTKERGQFHCPQCETQRDYRLRSVRRFFTLYFIPLIPLDKQGEFVECNSCKGSYLPAVLNYRPDTGNTEFLNNYEAAIKHSMVRTMLADGSRHEAQLEKAHEIINNFGHNDINRAELDSYVTEIERMPGSISESMSKVNAQMNEHGKEMVIRSAFTVAAANGPIDPNEIAVMQEISQAMNMDEDHMKRVLAEMVAAQKG